MDCYDITEIKMRLLKELNPRRYEHTLGVASTAFCLALKHGVDCEKAYVAGLLHDCAKCFSEDKSLALCKKYKLELTDSEKKTPSLIHAPLGAAYAKNKYGVEDEEILEAIKWHTTGKPDMSVLEKIVFIADYMEPNRKKLLGLDEIRKVAFDDLDLCMKLILENTIQHLKNKEMNINANSVEALKYYTP